MLRVLVGTEAAAGSQILRLIGETAHRIVGVLTTGLGELGELATGMGHRVWPASLMKDSAFAARVRAEKVDVLLNVDSLCAVHGAVVAAPRIGSFNLHPGPLPGYGGVNAPSWAIYQGEQTHAVTLHWMDGGIETGDIAYTAPVTITPEDTGYTLSVKCVRAGVPLIAKLLEAADALPPSVPRTAQPPGPRRHFQQGAPYAGRVPWTEPAQSIFDLVRAADYGPFQSTWGSFATHMPGITADIVILKVARTGKPAAGTPAGTVGEHVGSDVLVAAADEWVRVRRVRVDGQETAPANVFSAGVRLDA